MDSDREAFLRAIADDPADDGPRLVYADWLDEHGDADRAAFVRAQVERARLPDDDPRAFDLLAQERDLLARHRDAWEADVRTAVTGPPPPAGWRAWLGGWVDPPVRPAARAAFDWPFRRGFLSEIRLSVRRAVKLGPRLAGLSPFDAARLAVGDAKAEDFRDFAAGPLVPELRSLALTEAAEPSWLRNAVKAAPHLDELALAGRRVADVPGRSLPDQLDAMARTPAAGRLAALRLLDWKAADDAWDEGVAARVAAVAGPGLRTLSLRQVGLSDRAAAALLAAPELAGVEELDVSQLEGGGLVRALLAGPARPALRRLDLTDNRAWSAQEGDALAAWPGLATLTHLAVDDTGRVVRAVARSGAAGLTSLRLAGRFGGCRPAELAAIADGPVGRGLRRLDLSGQYRLGPAGLGPLASPALAGLLDLGLGGCLAGDGAAKVVAGSPHLAGLRRLDLSFNHVTRDGARALAAADWPHLTELVLTGNPDLTGSAARQLRARFGPRVALG